MAPDLLGALHGVPQLGRCFVFGTNLFSLVDYWAHDDSWGVNVALRLPYARNRRGRGSYLPFRSTHECVHIVPGS